MMKRHRQSWPPRRVRDRQPEREARSEASPGKIVAGEAGRAERGEPLVGQSRLRRFDPGAVA